MFKSISVVTLLTLYVTSYSQSITLNFTDGSSVGYNLTEITKINFSNDVMLMKKTDGMSITWNVSTIRNFLYTPEIVKIDEDRLVHEFLIFPNPVKDVVNVQYELASDEIVSFSILDIQGNIILPKVKERKKRGRHESVFQVEHLPKGLYFMQFVNSKGQFSKPLVIE